MPRPRYLRVSVAMAPGHARTFWARDVSTVGRSLRSFLVCTGEGEVTEPREIVVAHPADVLRERPARMNLTYAQLEVE